MDEGNYEKNVVDVLKKPKRSFLGSQQPRNCYLQ